MGIKKPMKKGLKKGFKNVAIEVPVREALKEKGISANEMIKRAFSSVKGKKTAQRIADCHQLCAFKKRCIQYYWKDCPFIVKHPDGYESTGNKVVVEFMKKIKPVKMKLIKEPKEVVVPDEEEDVSEEEKLKEEEKVLTSENTI